MSKLSSVLPSSYLPELELNCPTDLDEVFVQLAGGAHPLAGGTDILLWASHRGEPRQLVWTGGIAELQNFDDAGDEWSIGAGVPVARLIRSASFRAAAPAVADGAQSIGSVQLRHQATLIGNVCTASPAGDTLPGLLVHDAVVEIASSGDERRKIDLADFLVGPGKTDLKAGELCLGISVSPLKEREASHYKRFTERKALDLAFASVAARLKFQPDGETVSDARLALGAVGPTAFEASDAAAILIGNPLTESALQRCAEAAAEICTPISDHRASADYRRQLIRVLVADVVTETAGRAALK